MRVTRRKISEAIKEKTGLNIGLAGNPNIGCYHFYSDDPETATLLARMYSTTVYTCYINDLTLDMWVEEFESMLKTVIGESTC